MGTDEREDRAERTAHRILDANPGAPLLIPGAIDVRGVRRRDQSPGAATPATPPQAHDGRYDRERNEYEIAGGGAPAERTERPTTFLARLRRALTPAS